MLSKRASSGFSRTRCRGYTSAARFTSVKVLPDARLKTFRDLAFVLKQPALLPRHAFADLPAIHKWFSKDQDDGRRQLNADYLAQYGETVVPLELSNEDGFERVEQPLRVFLDLSPLTNSSANIYLAQAPISNLPHGLQQDIPTPELVLKAGAGDVYDSSIWLGRAPTYTPLHRDPNPNLFVQLAGRKIVRLMRPQLGADVFARVQERSGGTGSAVMRGEEMMQGAEKKELEMEVWGEGGEGAGFEAELRSGDALFIPRGWWHSVKGVGQGMTGSVNWWFR